MANRYWVGGTDTWNSTAGTKWATTSGGTGGASAPTLSDDVFIDGNSGNVYITSTVNSLSNSLDFTGFVGRFKVAGFPEIVTNLTLSPTMQVDVGTSGYFYFSGTGSITSNGLGISAGIYVDGTTSLADDFVSYYEFVVASGTLNANNKNVTFKNVNFGAGSGTIIMGSGTWTLTGSTTVMGIPVWQLSAAKTVTANTSTIKITDTSNGVKEFDGADKTYNNIWFSGSGTFTILGSNTFNDIKATTASSTLKLEAGETQTVSSFTVNGGVTGQLNLQSSTSGVTTTLSKSSGTVNSNYLTIQDITVGGGATWNAGLHSQDISNNSGWSFDKWALNDKPTATSYTYLHARGKQVYDDSSVEYDSATDFYDSIDQGAYTNVVKPSGTSYTLISKPS